MTTNVYVGLLATFASVVKAADLQSLAATLDDGSTIMWDRDDGGIIAAGGRLLDVPVSVFDGPDWPADWPA